MCAITSLMPKASKFVLLTYNKGLLLTLPEAELSKKKRIIISLGR